ncbi:MAG: LytR C-terminal domain-containing protein, partial [Nonomuraea sp.]|nr:LytR C-terminal domain-containing protein [Nonomuraea sp.]
KNEQVRVQVLNGSGKPGLAKQVADELAAQQFVIVGTGNATPTDKTSIRYAKSLADGADYADVVAGRLSKEKKTPVAGKVKPLSTDPAPAQKGGSGPIVQLVIGADWPGVRVSSVIPDALKDKTVDSTTNPCL